MYQQLFFVESCNLFVIHSNPMCKPWICIRLIVKCIFSFVSILPYECFRFFSPPRCLSNICPFCIYRGKPAGATIRTLGSPTGYENGRWELQPIMVLLMVQKSQTTTWDVFETPMNTRISISYINWCGEFLNHQQYHPCFSHKGTLQQTSGHQGKIRGDKASTMDSLEGFRLVWGRQTGFHLRKSPKKNIKHINIYLYMYYMYIYINIVVKIPSNKKNNISKKKEVRKHPQNSPEGLGFPGPWAARATRPPNGGGWIGIRE